MSAGGTTENFLPLSVVLKAIMMYTLEEYRVFFKDEETAIAAGYRPYAVCMKEAYKKWKENLHP